MGQATNPKTKAVRERAEELLRDRRMAGYSFASDPNQVRLVHELQVHQIELEVQNDDLQRARVEAEAALAKYTDLFEFAPIAYCTLTGDGRVTAINLTGARWLGQPRTKIIGRHLADFVAPESQATWALLLRASRTSAARQVGDVTFRPDANSAPVVTQFELERRSAVDEISGIAIDITVRVGMEAEIARWRSPREGAILPDAGALAAAKASEQARDAALFDARRLAHSRTDFLTHLSHELRSPLHSIMGLASMVRREERPDKAIEKLDKIGEAAEGLLSKVDDLLDLASVDAGRLTLDRHPFTLREVFDVVVALIGPQAKRKGLDLDVDIHSGLAMRELIGDPRRLSQILLHLANNAVKYTDRGSVALRAWRQSEETGSLDLRFEVQDTGIGVAADMLPQLFVTFKQIDESNTDGQGGGGLGLALSRRLAELMGGQVGASSQRGTGSVFWFAVRLAKSPAPTSDGRESGG